MVKGANRITQAIPTPWVIAYWVFNLEYFKEYFEQKCFKKSWKILKIFITLLCYGSHFKNFKYM
jgi:hypothetical protein